MRVFGLILRPPLVSPLSEVSEEERIARRPSRLTVV